MEPIQPEENFERANYNIPEILRLKKEELPLPLILFLQCGQGNIAPVKTILSSNKVDITQPILAENKEQTFINAAIKGGH